MTGKRQRVTARAATDEPEPKKKAGASSKKKVVEEATEADFFAINRILGFTLNYNHATKKYFGYSSFTDTALPFSAFPLLTRAPDGPGLLPAKLPSGDRGYFLGGSDPGDIFCAIVEAYRENRPSANMSLAPYKNLDIYLFNRAYYGPEFEKSSGHQDIQVIQNELLNSRQWGGQNHRLQPPIARVHTQKKYQKAVWIGDFFAEKLPEGLTKGGSFFTKEELSTKRESYNENLRQTNEIAKQKLAKKIESIAESDDDDEDSDDTDSE
jgi:hypothetical protein